MPKVNRLLDVEQITGAWAVIPTPALEGSEDWRKRNTVDVDETARVINALVEQGTDGIMCLGTLGEGATLTWEEKKTFIATIVESAAGRVPVFAGTTTLNTRDTVDQLKAAADLGADGTMLGIPMWCAPSLPTAVRFYKDVAEACPQMNIAVYANPEAFKFDFPLPFWAQVSDIPQVVMAKYIGIGRLLPDIRASRGRIRLLPIETDYYAGARSAPDCCNCFWTGAIVCGPSPLIALRDAVSFAKDTGNWTTAQHISEELADANRTFFPLGSFKEFSTYNIGLVKERTNVAGWMKAGPTRPPYHLVPENYLEGARQAGRAWAALHKKYTSPRPD